MGQSLHIGLQLIRGRSENKPGIKVTIDQAKPSEKDQIFPR